jgi:nucleotide-binding universal stress UspA family protein
MILCGTDLSAASEPALWAAASIAKKEGLELLLVHVLEPSDGASRVQVDTRLEQDAGELRRRFGINIETSLLEGPPVQRLRELAQVRNANLLVVGAAGCSHALRKMGSVPEELCQTAQLPVLAVRHADGFIDWCNGRRPLRVLLGSGFGDPSLSALASVAQWPDLALTVAHVAWPFGEHYRLGVSGPMPLDHLRPEVHHQLLGDLGRWAAQVTCNSSPKLKVVPGFGRIDSHLAQLAREKEADVLVVGNHQRNLAARAWHGSVSRNALHEASCNVLCVPGKHAPARVRPAPRVIVVPTDFSGLADRAVGVAYGLLEPGATLHLVHVVNAASETERAALLEKLRQRILADAEARGIQTISEVLEGNAPWLAIWQYASNHSADMLCLASHSRSAPGALVLGSQAQALLQHANIPVVIVPPDREH